jgi:hypothetical protein
MKILFTFLTLAIMSLTGKAYAQSNPTWIFNDKAESKFFMSHTTFNITMSGLTQEQVTAIYGQIKSNKDVASCSAPTKNAAGNYNIVLAMQSAHDGKYYAKWAQKMGIGYFVVAGRSKNLAELSK